MTDSHLACGICKACRAPIPPKVSLTIVPVVGSCRLLRSLHLGYARRMDSFPID